MSSSAAMETRRTLSWAVGKREIRLRNATVHAVDRKRVFAAGWSNGAQLAYRLALEHPEDFAGVAAISASLPVKANLDCGQLDKPIPVMIVNGTGSQSRRSGSPRTPGSGPPPVRSPLPATLPPEPTQRWHQLRNQTTPPHPPISGLRSTQNLSRRA